MNKLQEYLNAHDPSEIHPSDIAKILKQLDDSEFAEALKLVPKDLLGDVTLALPDRYFDDVVENLSAKITYATATKHTKVDTAGMLDRLFAKTTVDLSGYSEAVQTNIKNGNVVTGMTKEEVLHARGYPPFHQTISLKADLWKYWDHRFKTVQYKFQNNVVVSIVGGAV